jgi:hypothetical protein
MQRHRDANILHDEIRLPDQAEDASKRRIQLVHAKCGLPSARRHADVGGSGCCEGTSLAWPITFIDLDQCGAQPLRVLGYDLLGGTHARL